VDVSEYVLTDPLTTRTPEENRRLREFLMQKLPLFDYADG